MGLALGAILLTAVWAGGAGAPPAPEADPAAEGPGFPRLLYAETTGGTGYPGWQRRDANFDVIVYNAIQSVWHPAELREVRAINPAIILLGYMSRSTGYPHRDDPDFYPGWRMLAPATTLTAAIGEADTTIPVASTEHLWVDGSYAWAFLWDGSDWTRHERVQVEAVGQGRVTVVRGQGGRAQPWPAGTRLAMENYLYWEPQNHIANPTPYAPRDPHRRTFIEWLADRYLTRHAATFDGVMWDNAAPDLGYALRTSDLRLWQPADADQDGVDDRGNGTSGTGFSDGLFQLLSRVRTVAPREIQVGNGRFFNGSPWSSLANGRLIEGAAAGGWSDEALRDYFAWSEGEAVRPKLVLIGAYAPRGDVGDQRAFRWAFTTALLGDGYFGHDFGRPNRVNQGWYDEYAVDFASGEAQPLRTDGTLTPGRHYLGRPLGPRRLLGPDLWRRDFERGIVLNNSAAFAQTVALETTYRRIRGRQDPAVNDGSVVTSVTLPPRDGLVLLRVPAAAALRLALVP